MSRTKRGSKAPGYDYWSRRPYSGRGYGPEVKDICHGKERAQERQRILEEVKETFLAD